MRRILFAVLLATSALAGERYLGTIEATPPLGDDNFYSDGGGFKIPSSAKVSLWCSGQTFVLTDVNHNVMSDGGIGDGGTVGLPVASQTLFPTSTGTTRFYLSLDGGVAWGGNGAAIVRASSSTSGVICHVYERLGTE